MQMVHIRSCGQNTVFIKERNPLNKQGFLLNNKERKHGLTASTAWDCRDAKAVKSSFRGPGFSSQHQQSGGSQASINPVPGIQYSLMRSQPSIAPVQFRSTALFFPP